MATAAVSEAPHLRPYPGDILVLIRMPPWRLMVRLAGLALGRRECQALLPEQQETREMSAVFAEGDVYELQLADGAGGPTPLVSARLASRRQTLAGAELTFVFDEADGGLLAYTEETEPVADARPSLS